MKTYTIKREITEPRLVIGHDADCESPREWSNLGYFITKDSQYHSPDGEDNIYYRAVIDTEYEATDAESHIELIKEALEAEGEKVLAIYPVYKYEHSAVVYKLGIGGGFDVSNNGFYIITEESQKEVGVARKNWEKAIKDELSIYTQWANGEVYYFTLYDSRGEVVDSLGGLYDIEDIREYLPKSWADEELSDYFKN